FSSRRRHTRFSRDLEFRRVLFRSDTRGSRRFPMQCAFRIAANPHARWGIVFCYNRARKKKGTEGIKRARLIPSVPFFAFFVVQRSEERRVGKEVRSRLYYLQEKKK